MMVPPGGCPGHFMMPGCAMPQYGGGGMQFPAPDATEYGGMQFPAACSFRQPQTMHQAPMQPGLGVPPGYGGDGMHFQAAPMHQAPMQHGLRGPPGYGYGGAPSCQVPMDGTTPQAKFINTMLCRAAEHSDVQGILNIVAESVGSMNIVNFSTALHKLARLVKEDGGAASASFASGDPRLSALHAAARAKLEHQYVSGSRSEALPRCWATIAWAYGTLQVDNPDVAKSFQVIGELAVPCIRSFKALELTNLLWAFAKTQVCNERLFQAARRHILSHLTTFSPSHLSTLVWVYVTAEQYKANMLHVLAQEYAVRLRTSKVNPVELANLMWGLATAKVFPKAEVLHEVGCRALLLLPEFKLQELSILTWAFSRLGARHDQLFAGAAAHLCSSPVLMQQIHPQGIANLLWAFEKQKAMGSVAVEHIVLALGMLIPKCLQLLNRLKPQEFTCVCRALTKLGLVLGSSVEADKLFTSAARVGLRVLGALSPTQCVDLLEAFASFLSTGNTADPANSLPVPEVFEYFVEALLTTSLAKVGSLEHMSACYCVAVMASLIQHLKSSREHFVSSLAQVALQLTPERFSVVGQQQLAVLVGLLPLGQQQQHAYELDVNALRSALTAAALNQRTGPPPRPPPPVGAPYRGAGAAADEPGPWQPGPGARRRTDTTDTPMPVRTEEPPSRDVSGYPMGREERSIDSVAAQLVAQARRPGSIPPPPGYHASVSLEQLSQPPRFPANHLPPPERQPPVAGRGPSELPPQAVGSARVPLEFQPQATEQPWLDRSSTFDFFDRTMALGGEVEESARLRFYTASATQEEVCGPCHSFGTGPSASAVWAPPPQLQPQPQPVGLQLQAEARGLQQQQQPPPGAAAQLLSLGPRAESHGGEEAAAYNVKNTFVEPAGLDDPPLKVAAATFRSEPPRGCGGGTLSAFAEIEPSSVEPNDQQEALRAVRALRNSSQPQASIEVIKPADEASNGITAVPFASTSSSSVDRDSRLDASPALGTAATASAAYGASASTASASAAAADGRELQQFDDLFEDEPVSPSMDFGDMLPQPQKVQELGVSWKSSSNDSLGQLWGATPENSAGLDGGGDRKFVVKNTFIDSADASEGRISRAAAAMFRTEPAPAHRPWGSERGHPLADAEVESTAQASCEKPEPAPAVPAHGSLQESVGKDEAMRHVLKSLRRKKPRPPATLVPPQEVEELEVEEQVMAAVGPGRSRCSTAASIEQAQESERFMGGEPLEVASSMQDTPLPSQEGSGPSASGAEPEAPPGLQPRPKARAAFRSFASEQVLPRAAEAFAEGAEAIDSAEARRRLRAVIGGKKAKQPPQDDENVWLDEPAYVVQSNLGSSLPKGVAVDGRVLNRLPTEIFWSV